MTRPRVAALALWAAVLYCLPAQAQVSEPWTQQHCASLANFAEMVADFRDAGADMKRHLDLFRRRFPTIGPATKRVLERELMRVYAEGLPSDRAKLNVYTRCMAGLVGGEES